MTCQISMASNTVRAPGIGGWPKLLARASNAKNSSEFKLTVILAMNNSNNYPYDCFLDPRILNLHSEPGAHCFYGQVASMNFTAAMRISNCRGLLASLLRLLRSLVLEGTPKSVHFRLKFYMTVHKSHFKQK